MKTSLPPLDLSLHFARFDDAPLHRAALERRRVARWLRAALGSDVESAAFAVRIVDADEGQRLNREFRQRDYATNVLTFAYAGAPHVAADLALCAPVVAREAQEQGTPLAAHYAHLLVHGALHAQGWDHEDDAEAEAMQAQEVRVLAALGFPSPYEN